MDITDRIDEPPSWWVDGIPRYCEYHPHHASMRPIELLVRATCSQCSLTFLISVGSQTELMAGLISSETNLPWWDAYEDPPFHLGSNGFNCAGNHAGVCIDEVLQAWKRNSGWPGWERAPELEGLVKSV